MVICCHACTLTHRKTSCAGHWSSIDNVAAVSALLESVVDSTLLMTSSNAFLASLATKGVSSSLFHSPWISSSLLIIPTVFWVSTGSFSTKMFTTA